MTAGSRRALLGDWPNRADAAAMAAFERRYGCVDLGPVVVVVAAYREASTVPAVVAGVPPEIGGLRVTTLVVVDGEVDDTWAVAAEAGAHVCGTPENRGQGAALRLGYHTAIDHGAEFIVTFDGDGQYDPADIAVVLEPVLRGEADFVSGSRRLGQNRVGDPVRALGVVVFALAIRVLTGRGITDPAFGLRAMRAEVAEAVTLRQPQYQAAELLVGAIMAGFRVAERPATIRSRPRGRSHKGPDLIYGWHFGRALVSSWLRGKRR